MAQHKQERTAAQSGSSTGSACRPLAIPQIHNLLSPDLIFELSDILAQSSDDNPRVHVLVDCHLHQSAAQPHFLLLTNPETRTGTSGCQAKNRLVKSGRQSVGSALLKAAQGARFEAATVMQCWQTLPCKLIWLVQHFLVAKWIAQGIHT